MENSNINRIVEWIENIETHFPHTFFSYEFNSLLGMHIISVSNDSNILDDPTFNDMICDLYENFEKKYDQDVLIVPSNDPSFKVENPIYKTVQNKL